MKRFLSVSCLAAAVFAAAAGLSAAVPTASAGVWISVAAGYQRVQQNIDAVDTVFLDWWQATPGGGLNVHDAPTWTPDPAVAAYFRAHCVQSYGAVATDDTSVIADITGPSRSAFVANLAAAAAASGVDGIHLDIEFGGNTYRAGYSELLRELSAALHAAGKKLSVFTPGFMSTPQMDTGISDWSVLEAVADRIELGAYDLNFDAGADIPGPIQGAAPLPGSSNMSVGGILAYVGTRPHPEKYYLGIAWYAYLWIDSGSGWAFQPGTKTYLSVAAAVASHGGAPAWNATAKEFSYQYSEGGVNHLYWFGERQSSAAMIDLAASYGLPGVFAFQSLQAEDEGNGTQGVWDVFRQKIGIHGGPLCGATPPPTQGPTPTPLPTGVATPRPTPQPTLRPTFTLVPTAIPSQQQTLMTQPGAQGLSRAQQFRMAPSPFRASTRLLRFCMDAPEGGPARLLLYGASGERVAAVSVAQGCQSVSLPWLAPGIYLAALECGNLRSLQKLAVMP